MKRNIIDKTCYNLTNGAIGSLMTVMRLNVLANETVSINLMGSFKLSKLRRWLAMDPHIHMAAYFVKHRWCYNGTDTTANWDTFIKNSLKDEAGHPIAGGGSATTLDRTTVNTTTNYNPRCMAAYYTGTSQTLPAHVPMGYHKIWNRWYRIPNVTDEVTVNSVPNTALNPYGYATARLPEFWNTGVPTARLTADSEVDDGTHSSFSLVDIAQVQAQYQDELDREWFAHRYRDILAQKWGSNGVTNEVDDDQAELLMDMSMWGSGVDIHGTDQSSLGDYVGKSQTPISFSMPPRYFNEHGTIWVVMAVRFPSIVDTEGDYLDINTLTAKNMLGLPEVMRSEPPVEITEDQCFWNGDASDSMGKVPYGNWHRFQHNTISYDFRQTTGGATGFPIYTKDDIDPSYPTGLGSINALQYESASWAGMDRFFAETSELKHWNLVSKAEIEVRSPLPEAAESIYAGARHIN